MIMGLLELRLTGTEIWVRLCSGDVLGASLKAALRIKGFEIWDYRLGKWQERVMCSYVRDLKKKVFWFNIGH